MNKKTPEANREQYLKHYCGSFSKRIRKSLYKIKQRALKKGVDFFISVDLFEEITHCPLTGRKFRFDSTPKDNADSPSVDRIDSTKGYTIENTWIISKRANTIKNNATLEEFEEIARNWRTEVERRKKKNDK